MWSDLPLPIVVAHRGDRAFAPENTISAFMQAADKGADAVEFDVKLSADGQVIVIHDQTVDRTTDGTGNVAKMSLKELQGLKANVQFPDLFPKEEIPTLDKVFETVGKRLHLNIELTNYVTPGDDLVARVVDLIKKHRLENRILFSSFLASNLRKASALLPAVPRGLLTFSGILGWWGRTFGWRGNYYALNPYFSDTTAALVNRVHAADKRINVWTINDGVAIKHMIGLGVDGIITDNPALALNLLGRNK
jgi:glycerophosphoryl diester phosphodiesterase